MSTFPDVVQALGVNEVGERPIVSVADVQIQLTDTTLAVSPSVSFAPVLLLPSAAAMAGTPAGGKRYRVRDANGNAGTVPITISAPGALIDGAATVQISIAWGVAVIEWVGTGWQTWAFKRTQGAVIPSGTGYVKQGPPGTLTNVATIPNSDLTGSGQVTITPTSPITGGGAVALGGSVGLTLTTIPLTLGGAGVNLSSKIVYVTTKADLGPVVAGEIAQIAGTYKFLADVNLGTDVWKLTSSCDISGGNHTLTGAIVINASSSSDFVSIQNLLQVSTGATAITNNNCQRLSISDGRISSAGQIGIDLNPTNNSRVVAGNMIFTGSTIAIKCRGTTAALQVDRNCVFNSCTIGI